MFGDKGHIGRRVHFEGLATGNGTRCAFSLHALRFLCHDFDHNLLSQLWSDFILRFLSRQAHRWRMPVDASS
jgi:hypothetical protein